MIKLIYRIVDDVHVNGRFAAVKEMNRVTFEVGKVFVSVVEKHLVVRNGPVIGQQRVINEWPAFAPVLVHVICVPNGFRSPHAGDVCKVLAFVLVREMHRAVFPVDEVAGLHQHHASVACPAFGALHVGIHHVEPAVRCSQDVRVAEPFLDTDRICSNDSFPVVHGCKVVAVITQGVIDIFVVVCREIRKEVVGVRLKTVD